MAKSKSTRKRSGAKTKAEKYSVFVSHATADKWLAKTLCEKIEKAGASTFRDDRDIDGGDDIPGRIRQEIIRSNEMVVLMTPESVNRPWVLIEAGAAWGRRQRFRITPVLCHVQVNTIPDMISSKKAIHINDLDAYFNEIKKRVQRHKS